MATTRMDNNVASNRGLFICFIGLLFIVFTILLRTEPTVMGYRLFQQFHLSSDDMDNMMVKYQFSLILTYLFAGVIVDYVGSRTILIVASLLAIAGNYLFSNATTTTEMLDGRILMGYAHPFIFLGALTLGAHWLRRKHFVFYSGILFSALLLTSPLCKPYMFSLMNHIGWRSTSDVINCFGALLAVALLLTYRYLPILSDTPLKLLAVLRHPKIWLLSLISCLGWTFNTFLLNWGANYLNLAHKVLPHVAIAAVSETFICFALGAVIMGLLADLSQKSRTLIGVGYLLSAISFSIVLLLPDISLLMMSNLFFISAFFASAAVICYAIAFEFSASANAGLTFGLIAFITTGGNTLFALLINEVLEPIASTQPLLGPEDWQIPLAMIPIALVLGCIFVFFCKNKR